MEYDFSLFYAIWLEQRHPDWEIPLVHMEIINYFEEEDWGHERKKVLLLWRGVGKSQLVDLWVAYKLSKDPTLRFLLLSYDKDTSKKSSRNILNIIKTHPLCEGLFNKRLEVQKDSFFIEGYLDDRNPTVRAYGIRTSGTGGRSDYIIFDDVEDRNNSGTPGRRRELRAAISEAENTLLPNTGKVLFIGTFHDHESIYDEQVNEYGARRVRVPIMEDVEGEYPYLTGTIKWAERYSKEEIWHLQKKPRNEFFSQYMLVPTTIEDTYFDTDFLEPNRYTSNMKLYESGDRWYAKLKIGGGEDADRRIVSSTCYWDPALSKARGNDSVVALVLTDDNGWHYIHKVKAVNGDGDQQCEEVKTFAKQNNVAAVIIEDNGPGAFLVGMMLKVLNKTGIGVEAYHVTNTEAKAKRFVEAFEGPLYGGILHINQAVYDGPFLIQMREFMPKNVMNQKNDYLDAVAGAVLREPTYVGNHIPQFGTTTNWQGHGVEKIEWDFGQENDFTLDDVGEFSLND